MSESNEGMEGRLRDMGVDDATVGLVLRAIEERRELLAALKEWHPLSDPPRPDCATCALIAKCEAP